MILKELLSVIQIGTNVKVEILRGNNIESVTFSDSLSDIISNGYEDMNVLTATVKKDVFIITLCPPDD